MQSSSRVVQSNEDCGVVYWVRRDHRLHVCLKCAGNDAPQ